MTSHSKGREGFRLVWRMGGWRLSVVTSRCCRLLVCRMSQPTRCMQPVELMQVNYLDLLLKPRLHNTTCCQPVVKRVWQPVVSCIKTFNRLSNPFDNRFDNRLYRVYSRLSNRLYNWFNNRLDVCLLDTAGLTTGWNRLYRVNGV